MNNINEHHHNSNESISSSSLAPILTTQLHCRPPLNHTNVAVQQEPVALSVLQKTVPPVKNLDSRDLAVPTTGRPPLLPLIEHAPHKHDPRVLLICRSYMMLEHGKYTKQKLIVAWT